MLWSHCAAQILPCSSCGLAPPDGICLLQLKHPWEVTLGPSGRLGISWQKQLFQKSLVSWCPFVTLMGKVGQENIEDSKPYLLLPSPWHFPFWCTPTFPFLDSVNLSLILSPNLRSLAHSRLRMRAKQRTRANIVECALFTTVYVLIFTCLPNIHSLFLVTELWFCLGGNVMNWLTNFLEFYCKYT